MLLIFASEVAAFVGKNPYKPQWDAFERVWARAYSEQYAEDVETDEVAMELDRVQERAVAVAAAVSAQPGATVHDVQAAERAVKEAVCEHADKEVRTRLQEAAALLNVAFADDAPLSATAATLGAAAQARENVVAQTLVQQAAKFELQRADAVAKAASGVRCAFGTAKEAGSREQLVKSTGVQVKHSNQFHKLRLGTMPYARQPWGIGGRLDGLDEQGRVVEIKNRTRRFFPAIPEYERIQVACYMQLLKTRHAVIVEQLNGAQRRTEVEQDDAAWEAIREQLEHVVHVLDLFTCDDSVVLRRAWVTAATGVDKQSLLDHWLTQASPDDVQTDSNGSLPAHGVDVDGNESASESPSGA
jgi:hypothetical protein